MKMTNSKRYNAARLWLIFWTLFIGIGAVAGAAAMIFDPSGRALGISHSHYASVTCRMGRFRLRR